MTENELKFEMMKISNDLTATLCEGSDLPNNDCTFQEIMFAIGEAVNLGYNFKENKELSNEI